MMGWIRKKSSEESGMALVMVLFVMLLMAMLGTTLFTVSTTEIKVSRKSSFRTQAFYAAERGNEYAQADASIYTAIGTGAVSVPRPGVSLSAGGSDASGTVSYLSTGNPPRGSGVDVTDFRANYFLVDVSGTAPTGSGARVESSVAKVVPND